ncbi:hypothetical protein [Undibacterium sp. Ji49W]|uniref:hypothetical protein n=1 Tax=Undibacterium sp. Ji49W TaxID=3413040 RepID=UPI003BF56373
MKTIALFGGGSLCELDSVADVQLFFDCMKEFVAHKFPKQDWNILTDRLYRRYLRMEELTSAETMMEQVKEVFANVPNSAIDLSGITTPSAKTQLDPNKITLAEIFSKYFEHFVHCKESAEINYKAFKSYPGYEYEPVKMVIADMPEFMTDKKRPLEEYDALNGEPFWMRGK